MSSEYNITSKTIRFSLHIYQFRSCAAAISVGVSVIDTYKITRQYYYYYFDFTLI